MLVHKLGWEAGAFLTPGLPELGPSTRSADNDEAIIQNAHEAFVWYFRKLAYYTGDAVSSLLKDLCSPPGLVVSFFRFHFVTWRVGTYKEHESHALHGPGPARGPAPGLGRRLFAMLGHRVTANLHQY